MVWTPIEGLSRWAASRRRSGDLARWLVAAGALHVAVLFALSDVDQRSRPTEDEGAPPLAARSSRWPAPIGFDLIEEGSPVPAAAAPPSANAPNADAPSPLASRVSPIAAVPLKPDLRSLAAIAQREAAEANRGAADAAPVERGASGGASAADGAKGLDGAESEAEGATPQLSLQDLGIGAGANPFLGSPSELPTERQLLNQRLRQSFRGDLARHDQSRGLGPEGPAVAAVKEIVLASATAPNTSALLRVRTDAAGKVTLVDVLDADRDDHEWRRIADQLLQALAGKRLRVPPRSGGVSFQLRVVSRVQLPSGADPGLAVDLFGVPVKKGDGDKSAKLSLISPMLQEVTIPGSDGATMLVPSLSLIGGAGDIGDIGRVARRLATAYLVAMDTDVPLEAPSTEARPPAAPPPRGP